MVRARLNPKVANESNQEKVMMEANGEVVSGEGGPVPSIAVKIFFSDFHLMLNQDDISVTSKCC